MKKVAYYLAIIAVVLGLSGCAGSVSHMQVAKVDVSNIAPERRESKKLFSWDQVALVLQFNQAYLK